MSFTSITGIKYNLDIADTQKIVEAFSLGGQGLPTCDDTCAINFASTPATNAQKKDLNARIKNISRRISNIEADTTSQIRINKLLIKKYRELTERMQSAIDKTLPKNKPLSEDWCAIL